MSRTIPSPMPVLLSRLQRSILRPLAWAACAMAGLIAAAPAWAGKAHEHGAAKLDVAVEGNAVTLSLEMPLDSLVGFERAPRTDAEKRAAAEALVRMRDAGSLFRFDAAAQCVPSQVQVSAPVLEKPQAKAEGGHADLDAEYQFTCAQPAQIRSVEVLIFDALPRLERMQVQVASAKGQAKAVLRRKARVVQLGR